MSQIDLEEYLEMTNLVHNPVPVVRERANGFKRVSKVFELPTRTRGSETPSTDLKAIVARYQRVGALPPSELQYGDATELPTSRLEAMEIIASAAAAFAELPFKVRQAVNHDPRMLEQWIAGNPTLAREYGLYEQASPQSSPSQSPSSSGTDEGKKPKPKAEAEKGAE